MATQSLYARPCAFKLTYALMVVAACAIAVAATILASHPARPAAPIGVHLTEAEFAAAKCYTLREEIAARTDPAAVSAWSQKYTVDAEACRELLAKRTARAAQ
ncbi:MAG TPA: hypothetical protein VKI44_20125 [Acetobacteraceae bacterium]|nr:hypothetical protein [Acetobacteraceae bacterium]